MLANSLRININNPADQLEKNPNKVTFQIEVRV